MTFYPNVPWPVCVGPICRSIISGIPVLSLTGFPAWRVIICGNGFPPFRLFQYPDMNVIPVPPAHPRWVWPCSSSLRVLVGVPCDTWRWSVPILPWFVCAAKKTFVWSPLFSLSYCLWLFSSTMFQIGLFSWSDCLALELAVFRDPCHPWALHGCTPVFVRCFSCNDLHYDVILSQSLQLSQR